MWNSEWESDLLSHIEDELRHEMNKYQISYRIGDVPYSIIIRAKSAAAAVRKLQGLYVPAIAAKLLVITIEQEAK